MVESLTGRNRHHCDRPRHGHLRMCIVIVPTFAVVIMVICGHVVMSFVSSPIRMIRDVRRYSKSIISFVLCMNCRILEFHRLVRQPSKCYHASHDSLSVCSVVVSGRGILPHHRGHHSRMTMVSVVTATFLRNGFNIRTSSD